MHGFWVVDSPRKHCPLNEQRVLPWCDVRPDDMLAVESGVSAAHRADLTEQVLEHFDAGKLPLNAIADSDLSGAVAEDQSPA